MPSRLMPMLFLVVATLSCAAAWGQGFPSRPIRFISPFPPGGFNDALARLIGQKLSAAWGKPVVVDNRPGAHVILGTDLVAKAPPDGHTILMAGGAGHTVNPALYKLPYDSIRDFAPLGLLVTVPNVLVVHPSVPAQNVADLIAVARERPGQLNYASVGAGSSFHLAGELFQQATRTKLVHVPYKGSAPALTALMSGEVQVYFGNIVSVIPHVRNGKLKALGIAAAQRSSAMPELPTLQESGQLPDFTMSSWYGILAPARTPSRVVEQYSAELNRTMQLPDVRERLIRDGAEPTPGTPEQLGQIIRADIAKWDKVVRTAGIKVD
jgi:tripartite-type tricarboxylate transporter receptor subunit TctC